MYKILVVDDEDDIREAFCKYLSRNGFDAKEAADGNKAWKILQAESIDLVVTDIIMPDKEGVELILETRAKYPKIKIIAMSGGGKNIDAQDALSFVENLGISSTFQKPFNRSDMLEAIQKALDDD